VDADRLDRLLDPSYPGDVTELSMEELRSRRSDCQELEVALSYQRRMAQGRLDIVAAERARRAVGAEPPDHDDLVERLSGILADRTHAPGPGRLPTLMTPAPDELDTTELDALAPPRILSNLADQDATEIERLLDTLSSHEAEISLRRRALHERIDLLQAEITRRYRTGEASVETLLS